LGRGDRRKVRWAHDRELKKKEREKRKTAERSESRKGSKRKKK
jgi:hypothetical protein